MKVAPFPAWLLFLCACPASATTVLSLNLHGTHPMGEKTRWIEDRDGKTHEIDSYLYYFKPEELNRGHRARLDRLAKDITALAPEITLFQEVAAGSPRKHNCDVFLANPKGDRPEKNSVLRLVDRLNARGLPFQVALACRGNTGWITTPGSFRNERVVTVDARGRRNVVWDFGSNPYPTGLFTEGLAVLARKPWTILQNTSEWLRTGHDDSRFFYQAVLLENETDTRHALVVNIHASPCGICHFEQALALRARIRELFNDWNIAATSFIPVFIGGDFNQVLSDPSMIPWRIFAKGAFDFRPPLAAGSLKELRTALLQSNPQQAPSRIEAAMSGFLNLVNLWKAPPDLLMSEVLSVARPAGNCQNNLPIPSACVFPDRIDHIFAPADVVPKGAAMLYPEDNWVQLRGVSDHPGIWVDLNF